MKYNYPMHCLFQSNAGDVKMMPLMPYMADIMYLLHFGLVSSNGIA